MTPHELTLKGIVAGVTAIFSTLSTMLGAGVIANATGDATLMGINLSTLEKITLVTALMIVAIVLGYVAHRLFTRYDAIQTARIEDAKTSADTLHKVVQANTQAMDRVSAAVENNTDAVKELPRQLKS